MGKTRFIIIATILFLASCSTNDDIIDYYSEKQEKAFSVFNGTWADVQFSNLSDGQFANLLPEPDKIVFGIHNNNPIDVYKNDYIDGSSLLFKNQGECTYFKMPYKDGMYESVECYYEISTNADYLRLFKKTDNSLYRRYDMSIKNETKINLHDPNLTLPYIFVKQSDEEPQDVFTPISVFLTKGQWENGETMNMYVYPPNHGSLPQHYSYIESVEYYVDGKSVGKSSNTPFSISYIPNLSLGEHSLSLSLELNISNVIWETNTTSFTIIE